MIEDTLDGIAACVFDAYGTLFDIGASVARCRASLGEARATALIALWRRKQLEYSWLRSLMHRHADFWQVTGESLDHAMAALEIADPVLRSRLMEDFLAPKAFAEVPAVLEALRAAGLRTVILSNGTPIMLTSACRTANLDTLVQTVLSVEQAGVFKPHPAVYALAQTQLGLERDAIAFLSSNAWDVAGAATFGFRVVWVNRSGATPESLPGTPEAIIPDLSHLPGLLGL